MNRQDLAVGKSGLLHVGSPCSSIVENPTFERNYYQGGLPISRNLSLNTRQASSATKLRLGRIDDRDTTWVNGELLGSTDRWDLERVYDIPGGLLRDGDNTLTIRVLDTGGEGGFHDGRLDLRCFYRSEGELAFELTNLSGTFRFTDLSMEDVQNTR